MTYAEKAAETNGPIFLPELAMRSPRGLTDACRPHRNECPIAGVLRPGKV